MEKTNPSILLLSREKIPTNRAVISKLWCSILPKKGVNVFWMAESRTNEKDRLLKSGKLSIFLYSSFYFKNQIMNNFFSFVKKFRFANFLARNNRINQLQARNGISDGLICIIIKLVYGLPYSFHLSSLHGFADNSLIPSQRGFQIYKFKFRVIIYPFLYKLILFYASIIQPISKYMGNYLIKEANIDKAKIFPLPISSTIQEINNISSKELSSRPIIVYSGSIGMERDIDFIFELFQSLSKKIKNINFRIIGIVVKSTNKENLMENLEKFQIKDSTEIFLNMPPSQVPSYLSSCDIGISPINPIEKYIVSTPTKTIEYLSNGLPVVCNNEILDQEHIINNSKGGFAVPYSVNAFQEAIISLISNKTLYSKMSEEGKNWILNNRTYDSLSEPLIERYKEIV